MHEDVRRVRTVTGPGKLSLAVDCPCAWPLPLGPFYQVHTAFRENLHSQRWRRQLQGFKSSCNSVSADAGWLSIRGFSDFTSGEVEGVTDLRPILSWAVT